MPRKAAPQDAQVLIQLYDLRRDPVMRTARKFMTTEFWPRSYEEFRAVLTGYGTDQNAYLRQVLTYWDMAAAMVLHGAVHEELFIDGNSEPFFLYAKFGDYFAQARKDNVNSALCLNLDKLAARPKAKARIKALRERLEARRAAAAATKAASRE
jgi:hypothetical protein